MDDRDWEEIADNTPEKFICPQRIPQRSTNSRAENNVEISREHGDHIASGQDDYDDSYRLDEPTLDSDVVASVKSVKEDMLPGHLIPGVSRLLSVKKDSEAQIMKRRGRGTFSHGSDDMYHDLVSKEPATYSDEEVVHSSHEDDSETIYPNYGTSHALVFSDCLPSTKTSDLEKILEKFGNGEVVVRWINDNVAVAVFRNPRIAQEAFNVISCSFGVHPLSVDDVILYSIQRKDLEPPRKRPQTSTHVAKRLIAHGIGLKLSSHQDSESRVLRKKEEEIRKSRISGRQAMRDNAWGSD